MLCSPCTCSRASSFRTAGFQRIFFVFARALCCARYIHSLSLRGWQGRTTYYVLRTPYYVLRTTYYVLRTTYYLLRTTYYLLRTTYYVILTTYYALLTTYYVLRTTYYLLRTTYYLLLTTYYVLLTTYIHSLTDRVRVWCDFPFTRAGRMTRCPNLAVLQRCNACITSSLHASHHHCMHHIIVMCIISLLYASIRDVWHMSKSGGSAKVWWCFC
jgi:hypothetical protein